MLKLSHTRCEDSCLESCIGQVLGRFWHCHDDFLRFPVDFWGVFWCALTGMDTLNFGKGFRLFSGATFQSKFPDQRLEMDGLDGQGAWLPPGEGWRHNSTWYSHFSSLSDQDYPLTPAEVAHCIASFCRSTSIHCMPACHTGPGA